MTTKSTPPPPVYSEKDYEQGGLFQVSVNSLTALSRSSVHVLQLIQQSYDMHHQSRLRSSFRGWCFQWRPVLTDCCGTAPFRPIACWKPASVRRCDRGTWRRRRRRKLLVPFFLPPPLLADTLWLRSPPVSTSATLHVSMPYTHTHAQCVFVHGHSV